MLNKPCSFHRLVRPGELDRGELVRKISETYFLSYLPNNMPYKPDQKGKMGMYLSGIWYRLDLKPIAIKANMCDGLLLQEKILFPVFGISDSATDDRVSHYNNNDGWEPLLLAIQGDVTVVAFTLFL